MKKVDEYYRVAGSLPEPFCGELLALDAATAPFVQEIRLRAGQPAMFTVKGQAVPCISYLPGVCACGRLTQETLQECFLSLCSHSVYAHEAELAQGYLTLPGGHRVGVAGIKGPAGLVSVTSLNLRVARWVTCSLPPQIQQELDTLDGGLLIAGPPGSGKTTFLRSMIEYLSRKDHLFSVVDERGELMGGTALGLPQGRPARCDVYTHYPRAEGIMMALRTMSPQAIVCDELGSEGDAAAVEAGVASGVVFLASVHYNSVPQGDVTAALQKRRVLTTLLETDAFGTVVFLDGRARPGTVSRMARL